MCPKKKGRLDSEERRRPISLNMAVQPPKTQVAEGKKWRKKRDEPNLIRSFLISKCHLDCVKILQDPSK